MTSKNKNLEALIRSGWTPGYHGEFLDLYNIRSVGGGIVNNSNRHFIP